MRELVSPSIIIFKKYSKIDKERKYKISTHAHIVSLVFQNIKKNIYLHSNIMNSALKSNKIFRSSYVIRQRIPYLRSSMSERF